MLFLLREADYPKLPSNCFGGSNLNTSETFLDSDKLLLRLVNKLQTFPNTTSKTKLQSPEQNWRSNV